MSKILFLDVDSVLNTGRTPTRWDDAGNIIAQDPEKVFMVNKMVEITVPDLKVVLCSDWRHLPKWRETMKANGHVYEFLDRTPDLRKTGKTDEEIDAASLARATRGFEINAWLSEHPEVTHWAWIDDCDETIPGQKENFFKTEYGIGLTDEICENVVRHLTKRDC